MVKNMDLVNFILFSQATDIKDNLLKTINLVMENNLILLKIKFMLVNLKMIKDMERVILRRFKFRRRRIKILIINKIYSLIFSKELLTMDTSKMAISSFKMEMNIKETIWMNCFMVREFSNGLMVLNTKDSFIKTSNMDLANGLHP